MFLEVEEGGQDRDEEAVKVYLIRFIADLPLRLVYRLREYKGWNKALLEELASSFHAHPFSFFFSKFL